MMYLTKDYITIRQYHPISIEHSYHCYSNEFAILDLLAQRNLLKNLAGLNFLHPRGIPLFRVSNFQHHCFRLKLAYKQFSSERLPYSRNLKKIVTDGQKLSYMIVKIISIQDLQVSHVNSAMYYCVPKDQFCLVQDVQSGCCYYICQDRNGR